jgi:hypothetical protein
MNSIPFMREMRNPQKYWRGMRVAGVVCYSGNSNSNSGHSNTNSNSGRKGMKHKKLFITWKLPQYKI